MRGIGLAASAAALAIGAPAEAQRQSEVDALRTELEQTRERLRQQEERLNALETRLRAAETTVAAPASTVAARQPAPTQVDPAAGDQTGVQTVGVAPDEFDRAPQIAVLGDQGNVITRAGQLTLETQLEYSRADRNRALFRGIEIVESVLVGVFDINESRQDIISSSIFARYGLTSRFEVGLRAPVVKRNDFSVLAPVQGSTNNDPAQTRDTSAEGSGLGDLELSLRYQLTPARPGRAFLIGNLQVVAPTGSSPFEVPRDEEGRGLRAATGAGFWGVTPSVTAILPTDPAVLFGTLGYTHNFGDDVNTEIGNVRILRVKPGDAISASAGIGLTLNQRLSLNLGYAHSWAFGTLTRTELVRVPTGQTDPGVVEQRARDLQIGRLLFGVTYRVTDRSSINWAVEVGATDDAADLRTTLRVPFVAITGR